MAHVLHQLRLKISSLFFFLLPKKQAGIYGYLQAAALMGIALFLRLVIAPVDAGLQYVTFFPAVAIAAVLGGLGPGLFNTFIGMFLATCIFVPPYYSVSLDVIEKSFWGNLIFFLDGLIVSSSIDAMHRYRQNFVDKLEESKKNELRIQAINKELTGRAREIEKLNAELAKRANDAEAANHAKSVFLANMSHEIRTPLHVIVGLGQLLSRSPANFEKRVEHLCATSEHLLALMNGILDMSRIEADRFVLDNSNFCLGKVIERVQEVVGSLAFDKSLALIIDMAPALYDTMLRGDPMRLTQVLINLGSNAVKFSDKGVIRLGITVHEETGNSLRLGFTVQDNGIGIASEDQVRIFHPFEQVNEFTSRNHGGTGLGLSLSQRFVSLMGGVIRVDSQPGRGSIFSFEITLSRDSSSAAAQAEVTETPVIAGARVLVAEDHPLSQEIILEMLKDLGCQAEVATDGVSAVKCALLHAYDLILMDVQMPKMDGLATTRVIRALPGYQDTPIIALTANTFAEDRQRCLNAGMSDYIGKPVKPATLAAVLGQWLPQCASDRDEPFHGDELNLALAKIPGLDIEPDWRRSEERLSDYLALLRGFAEQYGNGLLQLREYLEADEHDAAHEFLNDIKTAAGLIGARRVFVLSNDVAQALDSGLDQAGFALLMDACEVELVRLAAAIRSLPVPAAGGVTT
jgi:signal transduction histidine kinase/CheY-like chemotaxis protein